MAYRFVPHWGAGVVAAALGLMLMATPPALAAGAQGPEWCRQNSSLTLDDYINKVFHTTPGTFWINVTDRQIKSGASNELFREVPNDVLIIPENVQYITLKDTSINILPFRSSFRVSDGILPAHTRFTDVCAVISPWEDALLVINENGYLRYIDAGHAQTVALYDAEMRLQRKFRPGAGTEGKK